VNLVLEKIERVTAGGNARGRMEVKLQGHLDSCRYTYHG
jgi:hypothetical protein